MNWVEDFEQYRSLLFAIAYRMLGSIMDAEDMVQETFIRWQQTAAKSSTVKSSKAYLTTIITRLCIDRLRSARVQREYYVGPWLPEPIVTESSPDPATLVELADSLAIAFLVLLERLSPLERAVFLLREVFGYDYSEISQIVDKNATYCRQIARRARQHLTQERSRFPTSEGRREQLIQSFMQASRQGEIQELLDLLAEDIALWSDGGGKVVATLKPLYGAAKVARFLQAIERRQRKLGFKPEAERVQVNGQLGIIYRVGDRIDSVVAVDIVDDRIQTLYFLRNPDKLERCFSDKLAEMIRHSTFSRN